MVWSHYIKQGYKVMLCRLSGVWSVCVCVGGGGGGGDREKL